MENKNSVYNQIYEEICELIGEENMVRIYEEFKGMQVSFPSKLYTKEYVMEEIEKRYDGSNAKELAREYNYTVKYFNQLIKESQAKN